MTSTSTLGTTSIIIQFDLNRNIDGAALDVQTALTVAQRRLPVEMTTPPFFRKVNPGDFPVLYISLISPTLPLSTVDDYGEIMLAQQISQLPGVAQVLVYGAQKFAVRVQVDPVAAAARNISLDDIRTVVAKTNSNTPVGTLAGQRAEHDLAASGAMTKAADYRKVVGRLSQRRAGQARGDRPRHRQRRERQDRQLVQQRARDRAGDPAAARRQHGRGGRPGAQPAAVLPRPGSGRRSAWRCSTTARSRSAIR